MLTCSYLFPEYLRLDVVLSVIVVHATPSFSFFHSLFTQLFNESFPSVITLFSTLHHSSSLLPPFLAIPITGLFLIYFNMANCDKKKVICKMNIKDSVWHPQQSSLSTVLSTSRPSPPPSFTRHGDRRLRVGDAISTLHALFSPPPSTTDGSFFRSHPPPPSGPLQPLAPLPTPPRPSHHVFVSRQESPQTCSSQTPFVSFPWLGLLLPPWVCVVFTERK